MATHLQIITPEKTVLDEDVEQVSIPTAQGQITVLPKHVGIVTIIEPGVLTYTKSGKENLFAAGFGFAQVNKHGIKILVDLAAPAEDLQEKAIEEAKKQAEEALKQKNTLSAEEYATAAANLQRSLAQLKIKRRHRR